MDSLKKIDPNLILVDGGDTGEGSSYLRAWKTVILWESMEAMGYDVITLGERDIADTTRKWLRAHEGRVKFLGGNMTPPNASMSFMEPYVIVKRNGVKIGFTAAMDMRLATRLPGLSLKQIEAALNEAQAAFARENVDFRVLIYHGILSDAETLAKERTDFDLILLGHSIGRPMQDRSQPGLVPIVGPGDRGRELAWITLKKPFSSDADRFSCKIVPLGNDVPDSPKAKRFLEKGRTVGRKIMQSYYERRKAQLRRK